MTFDKAGRLESCVDMTEVDFLAEVVTTAKSRHSDRCGYSPAQRVLGVSVHKPASLLSDDVLDSEMMATCPSAEFHGAAALRLAAQTAMLQASDVAALGRVARGRHITMFAKGTSSSFGGELRRP